MSVVCVGEFLTDCFSDGSSHPGGAPVNVAFHVAQAGLSACIVSRIGRDDEGRRLEMWAERCGFLLEALQNDQIQPTGSVRVRGASSGPTYEITTPAAWDFLEAGASALAAARSANVIVFGTLAQRNPVSRRSVRALVDAARAAGAVRFADLNLRVPYYDSETVLWTLRNADVLKMNVDELRVVSKMLGADGADADLFSGLVHELSIPRAVLTAGADGVLVHENGAITRVPPHPAEAVDTVGAGDAFTAALVCGLMRGRSLAETAPRAARLASWVVSLRGATPEWTSELRHALGD